MRGWSGKVLILVLLGFVATDFVITRSLSAADASVHFTHNPLWQDEVNSLTQNREAVRQALPAPLAGVVDFWNEQLVVTVILTVVGFAFWAYLRRGFTRSVLWLAAAVVGLYLLLTAVVAGSGVCYLLARPQLLLAWAGDVARGAGPPQSGALPALLLAVPLMALGLSGFELSMLTAPLVRGDPTDTPEQPRGRVRSMRRLLVAGAAIMAVFLTASVCTVTLLVPADAVADGGPAAHRALAYLAHGGALAGGRPAVEVNPLFGPAFGTLYDVSAILILCLAGASVMICLRDVLPPYLARYGMQLAWAQKVGVMMHLFNAIILTVTVVFRASVAAQQGTYAASVLVLLAAAALAAYLALRARTPRVLLAPVVAAFTFFLLLAALAIWLNPSGLVIALAFVAVVLVTAFLSRWLRSTELRFGGFAFADERSRVGWEAVCRGPAVVLVPHRPGRVPLARKAQEIRGHHRLGPAVPLLFVEAELGDPSEFGHAPLLRMDQEDGLEVVRVARCASIAHVLAALGLELAKAGRPPEMHFGWSDEQPLAANFNFLLWGEGNVPWLVHELLRRAEPDPTRRPRVVIG